MRLHLDEDIEEQPQIQIISERLQKWLLTF